MERIDLGVRFKDRFDNILECITTLGFILMLLCVVMQVVFRYAVHLPIPWTEEAARYFLIFVTFWGGAVAIRTREHISIPVLLDRLPKGASLFIQLIFIVAMGVFLVVVFRGSIVMTALTWNSPVGSISWLTLGRVYLILPTGTSLMLIYLVAWALEILTELRDITKAKAG